MAVSEPNHYHLISHVVFQKNQPIYGPIHVLEKYLLTKKNIVSTVLLPLTFEGSYSIKNNLKTKQFSKQFTNIIFKYLFEIWFVFSYNAKHVGTNKNIVIAVDPLNCFPAVLLKPFLSFKLIYYTADYTKERFPSKILNFIYFLLDQICLWACDENWCVSSRIVDLRTRQGYKSKAKFLPNTPIFDYEPQLQKLALRYKLIYVGRMDNQMKLPIIIKASMLLHKIDKKFELTLIGGGDMEEQIKKFIKKHNASSYIHYLGPLPNDSVINEIKKHGIGLALYSGGNDWNNFGDSMKIREYQYFGLPVLTTTVPSNCEEIEEYCSGIVLQKDEITIKNVKESILKLTKDFNQYSVQTVKNAENRLKEKLLNKLL